MARVENVRAGSFADVDHVQAKFVRREVSERGARLMHAAQGQRFRSVDSELHIRNSIDGLVKSALAVEESTPGILIRTDLDLSVAAEK